RERQAVWPLLAGSAWRGCWDAVPCGASGEGGQCDAGADRGAGGGGFDYPALGEGGDEVESAPAVGAALAEVCHVDALALVVDADVGFVCVQCQLEADRLERCAVLDGVGHEFGGDEGEVEAALLAVFDVCEEIVDGLSRGACCAGR